MLFKIEDANIGDAYVEAVDIGDALAKWARHRADEDAELGHAPGEGLGTKVEGVKLVTRDAVIR